MNRTATGIAVLQAAGISEPLPPAVRADVGEVENLARSPMRPPVADRTVDQPNSSSLVSALTRAGTGPKSPSAAFPGAT